MHKIYFLSGMMALMMMNASVAWGAALRVDSVSLESKSFHPSLGQSTTINVQSNQQSQGNVYIYNQLGDRIRTLAQDVKMSGKMQSFIWDGKDEAGNIVGTGVYFYTIQLKKGEKQFTYNPYSETQGHLLDIAEKRYDEAENRIYFTLPHAAMVRVRVNLKNGGPIISTPLDWTPLAAGEHFVDWNGLDTSGVIDLKNHPNRGLMIYAYSLADNSIIVEGAPAAVENVFQPLTAEQMAAKEFPLNLPADRYLHAKKDPRLNRVCRIQVEFPQSHLTESGLPILSGKSPVRVSIDPRDQWIAERSRYELMFFIDAVVVFEDESGFSPFTYYLNAQDLAEGEHVLTINLLTYDDHYAVISQKVYIKQEDK